LPSSNHSGHLMAATQERNVMRMLIVAAFAVLVGISAAHAQCEYTGWNFTDQDNSGNISDQCNDEG
jgi:hypothetical protein